MPVIINASIEVDDTYVDDTTAAEDYVRSCIDSEPGMRCTSVAWITASKTPTADKERRP